MISSFVQGSVQSEEEVNVDVFVYFAVVCNEVVGLGDDGGGGLLQVEELLKEFDNVCTLRVRMPITGDLTTPRNFITKITRYEKVVNIPNSMTILDELLPISIEMAKRNLHGIWNFTNPGVVSHNEILEMYKKYVDPSFTYKNFTLEEQAKVIVAARSNNELDASKLHNEFPEMLSIKDSLIKYVFEPNKKVNTFWASSRAAAAQDGCSSTMVPIFLFLHLITNLHLIRSNNLHQLHSTPAFESSSPNAFGHFLDIQLLIILQDVVLWDSIMYAMLNISLPLYHILVMGGGDGRLKN